MKIRNTYIFILNLGVPKDAYDGNDVYNSCIVYLSNKDDVPPIVTDTAVSLFLTPDSSDFVELI